jgi:cephalosporin-C deacetylase
MWIIRPEHSNGGLVIGQGYGNPAVPPASRFGLTVCFANVRGLGLSQCKEIPWQPHRHVLHGIDSKENYILRGVISDQWMAARVMLDMFPDCAGNLNYMGGSMGGGMGALLLPWDKRFKAAALSVPTFGAEIRFDYRSTGSGEACRKYVLEHPEARKVLEWFDASAAARYISIPVCCTPALFDPCVAPAGQFSVVNAVPEQYKTVYIRETGHFANTPHDNEVEQNADLWCKEHFAPSNQ